MINHSDFIFLENIEVHGCHGLFEEEKLYSQPFIFNLKIQIPLTLAGNTDDINTTIDYAEIEAIVINTVEKKSFNLIEKLSLEIIKTIFNRFPTIESIFIECRKPRAPLQKDSTVAGISLYRESSLFKDKNN